jgi:hypothetical protein
MKAKVFVPLTTAISLCVFALLGEGTGPLLADGTVVPQLFQNSVVTSKVRIAPLTKVAACMPQDSSCTKGSDCCSGFCDPRHNKCGK